MSVHVKILDKSIFPKWDSYVNAHPGASLYHLSGWKNVIENTYGHKTYYLIAVRGYEQQDSKYKLTSIEYELNSDQVIGILPLVHLKHFIFGNRLISIPFFDFGGILANDKDTEVAFLLEAMKLGKELGVSNIEMRNIQTLPCIDLKDSPLSGKNYELSKYGWTLKVRSHKVRMLLELPDSSEVLLKSFKSKLRSQIKKPLKEGLESKTGGLELLDDFYSIFTVNMRDLGSPVHSKNMMRYVLEEFQEKARIIIIYKDKEAVACSLVVGYNQILENPWASTLRKFNRFSPNMLLYWKMLEYACDNGYRYFDFGRSTPDGSTYRFKKQWGAKPIPLHWIYISKGGNNIGEQISENSKFEIASQLWKKFPVSLTRVLGPRIRKYIGL